MGDYSFKNDIPSIKFVMNELSHNPNLNDWEKGFIKNNKEYSDDGGFLNENCLKILSDLWEKY